MTDKQLEKLISVLSGLCDTIYGMNEYMGNEYPPSIPCEPGRFFLAYPEIDNEGYEVDSFLVVPVLSLCCGKYGLSPEVMTYEGRIPYKYKRRTSPEFNASPYTVDTYDESIYQDGRIIARLGNILLDDEERLPKRRDKSVPIQALLAACTPRGRGCNVSLPPSQ